MIKFPVVMAAAALTLSGLAKNSTPAGFTDDLEAAKTEAKASGRDLYVCFSGSDWCGWCKRLDKEVLSQAEFIAGATNHYVLVYIDSPNDKSLLSGHAAQANEGLVKKYKIRGFPTALILDAEGVQKASTGYRSGGPAKYLNHLAALRKNAAEIARLNEEMRPLEERLRDLRRQLRKLENAD